MVLFFTVFTFKGKLVNSRSPKVYLSLTAEHGGGRMHAQHINMKMRDSSILFFHIEVRE